MLEPVYDAPLLMVLLDVGQLLGAYDLARSKGSDDLPREEFDA